MPLIGSDCKFGPNDPNFILVGLFDFVSIVMHEMLFFEL